MNRTLRLLFVCLLQAVWAVASAYNLKVEATPHGACSLNTSGGDYNEGSRVYLRTYGNTGYVFKGWYKGDDVISSSASFYYTMPAEDVVVQARYEYNPGVPADPAMPEVKYKLNIGITPYGAGRANISEGSYTEGTRVSLRAYINTGYHFTGWTDETGETLSTSTSYTYVMPGRNAKLTANYYYDPTVPADPDSMATRYTVEVKCKPVGSGTFNTSSVTADEGSAVRLYSYTNTGFIFKRWEDSEGKVLSTAQNFYYTIPHGNSVVYGVFEYDPPVPSNPAKNYWNKELGEVIVDDFSAGSLGNAVSTVISGSSRDDVAMITVAGRMNDNDFGIANDYTNCTLLDLSRVTGIKAVPSYAFDYTNLESVYLPASIETIGYRAFYECKHLSSLTIYAVVPPAVEGEVFSGIPEGLIVYVPEGSIELYESADVWKDFVIMPIRNDVHCLELNLPNDCQDGRYKNMALELVNINSGQKYKYIVTDRLNYIFSNLIKNTTYNAYLKNLSGIVLAEIEGIEIEDKDISLTFSDIKTLQTVKLNVVTPQGTDVTSQLAIQWVDTNDQLLIQGNILTGQVEGCNVRYSISLPKDLAMMYVQPADSMYLVKEDDNSIVFQLKALPQLTLKGKIVDLQSQNPISNAVITASQTINGKYSKAISVITDAKGDFSFIAFATPTKVTFAEQEHITQSLELTDSMLAQTELNFGTIALKAIAGFTITTTFTYRPIVESDDFSVLGHGYYNHQNVTYSIYNKTQRKTVTKFSVQYPKIVLLEEVSENDVLQITAKSKDNTFNDVTVEVIVNADNRADATFEIVQLGAIKTTFSVTDNMAVVAMLYDAAGLLVKKYKYDSATLYIPDIADGEYTLITMGESDFFNSISSINSITEIGLAEGIDYISNKVSVRSGKLTTVKIAAVPFFDESKLYYTGENTSFTVNKASIVIGNYLTFTAKVDFKEAYASQVSDISLIVDMPEESNYVNGSMMIGTKMGECVIDGHRITVPIKSLDELSKIRYCAIPTKRGEYSPTAYIMFTLAGRTIQQPIGSASYTAKILSINVPKTIAKSTFFVSGTATGKAKVDVYDGMQLIGSASAMVSGQWSVQCELVNTALFSKHDIYAVITTKDGAEMETETRTVTYNPYRIGVKNVHMINTAHGAHSLELKEYDTVFDFQNPSFEKKIYWYWPIYPDFTFIAELTSNDTKIIDRVYINVFTEDGKTRRLQAYYNTSNQRWVASDKFHTGHLPVNVSVTVDDCQFNLADSTLYENTINELMMPMEFQVVKHDKDSVLTNVFDRDNEFVQQAAIVKEHKTYNEIIKLWLDAGYDKELETDSITLMLDSISGNYVFIMKDETQKDSVWTLQVKHLVEHWRHTSIEDITTLFCESWQQKVGERIDCEEGIIVETYKQYLHSLKKYTFFTISYYAFNVYLLTFAYPETLLSKELIGRITYTIKRHFSRKIWELIDQGMKEITKPFNCSVPEDPSNPVDGESGGLIDPSGFVYEGIESNRLQGVTATCYYKETVEDMWGDKHENIVKWNAEDYAQQNPLFTDENGMYQWDVPQGLWQVKFEKDGYETAYSEWLPVPPPQLEVNIGMVQNTQPEVISAKAYETGVEIAFSKYMQPETLNSENLYLKVITGSIEELLKDVTIETLDLETVSKADATQYASKVAIRTTRDLGIADEVHVIVSNKVKSYAGIFMAETFTQKLDVEKKVRQIVVEETYNIGCEQNQTIIVGALPNEACKGKTLKVKAASNLIASIEAEGAAVDDNGYTLLTLDKDGQASLKVNGKLFGTTGLMFKMQDSDVSAQSVVNVLDPAMLVNVKDVMASRISGTTVYRGQTVSLLCETEGASIYYTLDGSCPCEETARIKYDGKPIVINGDMTLKAMAVGVNGSESEVKEFTYSIKKVRSSIALVDGWNWASHNQSIALTPEAFKKDGINRVMTLTGEITHDDILGFVGHIEDITATDAVKVQTAGAVNISLTGEPFNPNVNENIVSLKKGWNWLGYPLDQTMTVSEALAHLEAEEGDYITYLGGGFAQYSGGQWQGDLGIMVPGQGFLYKSMSGNSFLYNDAVVSKAQALNAKRLVTDVAPWSADAHRYPDMMCVTAELYDGDTKLDGDDYYLGAFVGDECRGVAKYINGKYFLSVYGDKNVAVSFVAVEKETGVAYSISEAVGFKPDALGSVSSPYVMNLSSTTAIDNITADDTTGHEGIYNTLGQRVNRVSRNGIFIHNGKKVLIKVGSND